MRWPIFVLLAPLCCVSGTARAASAACHSILPSDPMPSQARGVTPLSLARLRDVGPPAVTSGSSSPFALSPDGTRLAFVMTRGDPVSNTICSALVVLRLDGKGAVQVLDLGGRLPLSQGDYRGIIMTTGFPQPITPQWAPDGDTLYYRKEVAGRTRLVRISPDASSAVTLDEGKADVEAFSLDAAGTNIVYAARTTLPEIERRIDDEALGGWLYDARVLPQESLRPRPWSAEAPPVYFHLDLKTRAIRSATPQEAVDAGLMEAAGSPANRAARVGSDPLDPTPESPRRLWAVDRAGRRWTCLHPACAGRMTAAFWSRSGREVVFIAREGWNGEQAVLYRWRPDSGRLSEVLRTRDSLTGCIPALQNEIVCGRESAISPRRVVAIDLATGRTRVLFDPNPEFAQLTLGPVRRLRWSTYTGLPVWGDLVLPPDHDHDPKLPLIVVLYDSRGFLRGGTGDEYPIFALAAQGFAVLSIQRPPSITTQMSELRSWDAVRAAAQHDWAERRSMHSAVMTGVDLALQDAPVDPEKIGITGLSDGASTVEFALIHSDRFSAAAISTCCDDSMSSLVLGGFAWGDRNRRYGFPPSHVRDPTFWQPLSLSQNAPSIDTPLLMQLADRETLLALQPFGALREAGKPAELYVFPDEYHNKWQPAHRLAAYNRVVDWFRFWLMDAVDPSPDKEAQYARWKRMRVQAPGIAE